jgi:hypothetical protein
MSESRYTASLSRSQGRKGWSVIFRHPQPHESYGPPGSRVRRGLGTDLEDVAQRMVAQLNEILADRSLWSPSAREQAARKFADPVVRAFYDVLAPALTDFLALRDQVIPLPGAAEGFARALFLGTYGAGKTTLVRQLIGTDPKSERFPSTSASKTTTADIEIVMRPGDYEAVVTFLQKEQVRAYIEDCVSDAVLAAVDGKDDYEVERQLLEHRDQRFRLSYLLVSPTTTLAGEDLDDPADDELDEGAEEVGVNAVEVPDFPYLLPSYVEEVKRLSTLSSEELSIELGNPSNGSGEDRDAFEELLEEYLRDHTTFQDLVDRILDDVEIRFGVLAGGRTEQRADGWPIWHAFEAPVEDRTEFITRVNRFSTNNARLFGQLLTPLVQGIRVAGPFSPAWADGQIPPLVLIDGEGFGHASNTVTSLPSATMRRLSSIDVVLLVDNAAQPMQPGPGIILRGLLTSGHESKLRLAFTKFDLVRGANLRDTDSRKNHVRASLDNAIEKIGKILNSRSAERALEKALQNRVFYLSDLRKLPESLSPFTKRQLEALLSSLLESRTPTIPAQAVPVYDEANLILRMQAAMQAFHEFWHARLGLPSRDAATKEHWTRVKAMTRWISQLNAEGYDNLTPVADLEQAIRDKIYQFLEQPLAWNPATPDSDTQGVAIAAVRAEVNARLRDLSLRRLIQSHFPDWAEAYSSHSGSGSTRRRAAAVDLIYDLAAPVPGETAERAASEFLREIRVLVREAIGVVGGQILDPTKD